MRSSRDEHTKQTKQTNELCELIRQLRFFRNIAAALDWIRDRGRGGRSTNNREYRELKTKQPHVTRPITARPVSAIERSWRWCRRKPALAGVWAFAMLLLLTLGIGGTLFAVQQANNATGQTRLRGKADAERSIAQEALKKQQQAERDRLQAEQESLQKEVQSAVTAMSTARSILVPYTISTLTRLPQKMVLPELQRQFDQADVVQRLSLFNVV